MQRWYLSIRSFCDPLYSTKKSSLCIMYIALCITICALNYHILFFLSVNLGTTCFQNISRQFSVIVIITYIFVNQNKNITFDQKIFFSSVPQSLNPSTNEGPCSLGCQKLSTTINLFVNGYNWILNSYSSRGPPKINVNSDRNGYWWIYRYCLSLLYKQSFSWIA